MTSSWTFGYAGGSRNMYPVAPAVPGSGVAGPYVPPAPKNNLRNDLLLALGGMLLLGGLFFSRRHSTRNTGVVQSSNVYSQVPVLQQPPSVPQYTPVPLIGIGGARDTIRPILTGIQNIADKFGSVPYVCGTFKVFPKLAAEVITRQEGNDSYLYASFVVGIGEHVISDLRLGDTPIGNVDGASWEVMPGTLSDPAPTLYTQDMAQDVIADPVRVGNDVIHTAPQEADQLSVEISFDNGIYSSSGGSATVQVNIYYRLNGTNDPWTHVPPDSGSPSNPTISVTENNRAAIRKNKTWTVTRGLYDVKVVRVTANAASDTSPNVSNWAYFRAYKNVDPIDLTKFKDGNGNQVGVCRINIKVKATNKTQGMLSQINCLASRKISAYNTGTGLWSAPAVSSSPAWQVVEMLTGNKRPMAKSDIDGAAFASWDTFCANNGLTFNHVYDSPVTCGQVCDDIATLGRAILPQPFAGKQSVIIEQPRSQVAQHFTPANIIRGSFIGEMNKPDVPHGLRMQFINQNAKWEQDELIVYDDGQSSATAYKFQTVPLLGCTDATLAYKRGRYDLAAIKLRPRRISFSVDWENLLCQRGDLVRFSHWAGPFGICQGRILAMVTDGSGNVTSFTGSEPVGTLDNTKQYSIKGVTATNSGLVAFSATVDAAASGGTNYVLSTPIAAANAPQVFDRYAFGYANQESIDLIVDEIEYGEDLTARLTCVDYAPAIYTADQQPIPDFTTGITVGHDIGEVPAAPVIIKIASDESVLLVESDGSYKERIALTLLPPDVSVAFAEVQVKRSDSSIWSPIQTLSLGSGADLSVFGVQGGVTYDLRIRYVTSIPTYSEFTTVLNYPVIGATTPPPPVVAIDFNGDAITIILPDLPRDYAGIEVRYNEGVNANYDTAVVFAALTTQTVFHKSAFPPGTITLMVSTVDMAGNKSTPHTAIAALGDTDTTNVILTQQYEPTFPGTISGGTIVSGVLQAIDSGLFWPADDAQLFWRGLDSALFWNSIWSIVVFEFTFTPTSDIFAPFQMYLDLGIDAETYTVEYAPDNTSLFWDGLDTDLFWATPDTALFWPAQEDYRLWPGVINGEQQTYRFRITMKSSAGKQAKLSKCRVLLIPPTISDILQDVIIPLGGKRLPITQTFRSIQIVSIDVQYDANYPNAFTAKVVDKGTAGPYVIVHDTNGVSVAGKIDAIVRGI